MASAVSAASDTWTDARRRGGERVQRPLQSVAHPSARPLHGCPLHRQRAAAAVRLRASDLDSPAYNVADEVQINRKMQRPHVWREQRRQFEGGQLRSGGTWNGGIEIPGYNAAVVYVGGRVSRVGEAFVPVGPLRDTRRQRVARDGERSKACKAPRRATSGSLRRRLCNDTRTG
jgi:hypothetical protein